MTKRWHLHPPPEQKQVNELATCLGVDPAITSLLVQKGIVSFEQAKAYFRPALADLHDPFCMKGMYQAVERLDQAITRQEPILVYGDYDVDGTTSVAMFYQAITPWCTTCTFYIPDRATEGYGISQRAITWAAQAGFKLIISLDCGIQAIDTIQLAQAYGIDFIVCDHHEPGKQLPPAYAILNPKQADCPYPCKVLSGCGVGFKLLQAWSLKKQLPIETVYQYLDLVAVSIACDIVPIVGENRILAYHGLHKLNITPQVGLKALMEVSKCPTPCTIAHLLFKLGPRINAAGRIDHARLAVQLLIASDPAAARSLAQTLDQKNQIRRTIDTTTTEEALAMIHTHPQAVQAKATVLFKPDWHSGVIGIIAARCIEHYYRPTVILTAVQGKAKGSARSVVGYNIYEALKACAPLLDQYGGHAYAAGLTMPLEQVAAFQQQFEAVVASSIQEEQLTPVQNIDLPLTFNNIHRKFCHVLQQMAPFGIGNRKAVFTTHSVIALQYRILQGRHLKLTLQQPGTAPIFDAIGFDLAAYETVVCDQKPFQMVYTIEKNHFYQPSIQLYIKDIAPATRSMLAR